MATRRPAPVSGKLREGLYVAALAIHTTLASCEPLDAREVSHLAIKPPASVTSVTAYGCETEGGTYVLINSFGTGGTLSVTAAQWTTLTGLIPYPFLKFVSAGSTGNAVIVARK